MRRSREEWSQVVGAFERSGQSHEAFCAQQHINVGSFRGWLYRLRRGTTRGKAARSATRLLPVRVSASGAAVNDAIVIDLEFGGVRLRVPDRVDPHYVAALVAALASRC
jgi:hypothetical protein